MKIKTLFLIALICLTACIQLIAQPSDKPVNTKALVDSLGKANSKRTYKVYIMMATFAYIPTPSLLRCFHNPGHLSR